MMDLKGSKTEANLMAAFAGESMAHTKYMYYEKQARKDGYLQIANIFEETAHNEKAHGHVWFKLLHGGMKETAKNLNDAINGEYYEWSDMYAKFAQEAKEEGFDHIAFLFKEVSKIEKDHEDRFRKLSDNMKDGIVFERETSEKWICNHCGHIYQGDKAPEICPVCTHPQGYFKIKAENY